MHISGLVVGSLAQYATVMCLACSYYRNMQKKIKLRQIARGLKCNTFSCVFAHVLRTVFVCMRVSCSYLCAFYPVWASKYVCVCMFKLLCVSMAVCIALCERASLCLCAHVPRCVKSSLRTYVRALAGEFVPLADVSFSFFTSRQDSVVVFPTTYQRSNNSHSLWMCAYI